NEIQELEEKIKQKKMSAEAREKVEKELKKLKMMSPMSAEATVVRNYIDWLISLPWHEYTEDKLDIKDAEKVLEDDHFGLDKVKQRILEYLDPEQNSTFNDHYLDVDYDLSKVMFVTTANTLERIPRPLQDRMEIIRIAGYTELEKLNIAKRYLIPKQQEANGLKPENIALSDSALMSIVRHYTKEAGVRNLEREIASVCRKVAVEVVKKDRNARIRVSAKTLS